MIRSNLHSVVYKSKSINKVHYVLATILSYLKTVKTYLITYVLTDFQHFHSSICLSLNSQTTSTPFPFKLTFTLMALGREEKAHSKGSQR